MWFKSKICLSQLSMFEWSSDMDHGSSLERCGSNPDQVILHNQACLSGLVVWILVPIKSDVVQIQTKLLTKNLMG